MSKKILITGSTGFIGSNVSTYFRKNTDWDIYFTSTDLTKALPSRGYFDVILHLASLSSVEKSIAEPVSFVQNNVAVTTNVLEYARENPPKLFINFSTTGIYTSETNPAAILDELHNDWGAILPTSPYIASKIAQEAIAISYYRTYGVPVIITSANNVIGPGQSSDKFVPKLVSMIAKGEQVPIYACEGTYGSRIYNPVNNISDALVFIINEVQPTLGAERPDRYSLGGGERLDNMEMAQTVAKLLGKPLKYRLVEASSVRPGYDQHYDHVDEKLLKLGWKPKVSLTDGLKEIISEAKR
jgi:dTDP-glucose 4,6-dehydratase